jgi:alkanesulfonate monooxygenase SsuD/methylene tetrahydromethanopterin reductase-like flavin-dependent oxidoreductase (luciferase family)
MGMDFGICVAAKIDDVGYIARAEQLGYRRAWVADSQMIWSDCFAVLALAAQQTRTIQLGTGVAVVGTRAAPVTAAAIATINRLAPGRTFLGIGTGNTALRLMGRRPVKLAAYRDYLRTVRGLLRGEEVEYREGPHAAPVRFLMPELGFIDVEHPVPIYVSGFGPKAQALAGELGDGLVMSIPAEPGFVQRALKNARAGAEQAGRTLENFHTCSLTSVCVLEPGEDLRSERVIRTVGPFALSSLHYLYELARFEQREPPTHLRPIWQAYTQRVEQTPASHRHLRIHAGHCVYILPEEAEFVTPELIEASCMVGRPDALAARMRALADAGLGELMLLPSLETQYRTIEDFATQVMRRL